MTTGTKTIAVLTAGLLALTGCGQMNLGLGAPTSTEGQHRNRPDYMGPERTTIWDAFRKKPEDTTVKVNKYLWNASLEVLGFLPVQTVDPFTGVIVTGFGTPPGGGRAYRATVHISDPALEARSLHVAIQSKGGPVSGATQRAVEDAILTRARQLRGKDKLL